MAGHQGTSTRNQQMESLAGAIEAERRSILTMVPGKVVAYDAKRQKATIRPSLKHSVDGEAIEAPDLLEVPVAHPRGGGTILHTRLKPGDEVMLHVASRSLDQPVEDGEAASSHPGRMHNLSDSVAVPASISKGAELANMPNDGEHIGSTDGKRGMRVNDDGSTTLHGGGDGGAKMKIDASGKVDLMNGGESLLAILRDLTTAFRDHLNASAPMDGASIAKANQILTRLGTLGL